ncbi:MAG: sigma-70 family RNA polymerase sigma factor [Gemmatimonadaceae bacterium]
MTEPVLPLERSSSVGPFADAAGADSRIFARLFAVHADALRRYAQRFVRTRDIAEDIVQEVFLGLWERRTRVDVGVNIRAYLYAATRSRALNQLKRERYEASGRKRYVPPVWVDEGPALPPDGVEGDEITRALEQILEQMPPRQAEILKIRLQEGLSSAKIAERLGISPRTVETHILRGTKLMRELLPKILGGEQPAP